MTALKEYPHRKNQDGTWDSICRVCFQTIAHRQTEKELADAEKEHVCKGPIFFDRRNSGSIFYFK